MEDKLDMQSPNWANLNAKYIADRFPNCVTETAEGIKLDFDLLKQELLNDVIDGNKERYRLEWPGKREAVVTANLPTTKTLRPVREDSVDFDNTENLYIEGDNLEVLKLLQESYLGKIKMIYIDPPYNTGKDFVYKDNFTGDKEAELVESGQKDEYNQRLVVNPETAGRYHSDWLTMMYPRLKLARNLLTDDGVIFISIDDNEVHNLRKICDEVFGEGNFLGCIVRTTGQTTGQDSSGLGSSFDYLFVYSKMPERELYGLPLTAHDLKRFENEDEKGKYAFDQMRKTGSNDKREDRPNMYYSVLNPDGEMVFPIGPGGYESCWRFEKATFNRLDNEGYILWKKTKKENMEVWWPYVKYYLEGRTKRPSPLWDDLDGNKKASRDLREMFDGKKIFDFSKPSELIRRIITISCDANSIILDFFSGSATTAHAVMQLNAEDCGNRKYIMVQLPEATDEKSEACKAGYATICEIGKERIRRAAKKIKEETGADIDYGFRVYRLDASNMQDVYYKPQYYKQTTMDLFADNVKPDRTADDLLAQVMLDWGLPLSLKIEQMIIAGKHVLKVAGDSLYACFDKGIGEDFAKAIAQDAPLRIVFRDNGFTNDTAKTNVKQLLKQLSPETEMKVL